MALNNAERAAERRLQDAVARAVSAGFTGCMWEPAVAARAAIRAYWREMTRQAARLGSAKTSHIAARAGRG